MKECYDCLYTMTVVSIVYDISWIMTLYLLLIVQTPFKTILLSPWKPFFYHHGNHIDTHTVFRLNWISQTAEVQTYRITFVLKSPKSDLKHYKQTFMPVTESLAHLSVLCTFSCRFANLFRLCVNVWKQFTQTSFGTCYMLLFLFTKVTAAWRTNSAFFK